MTTYEMKEPTFHPMDCGMPLNKSIRTFHDLLRKVEMTVACELGMEPDGLLDMNVGDVDNLGDVAAALMRIQDTPLGEMVHAHREALRLDFEGSGCLPKPRTDAERVQNYMNVQIATRAYEQGFYANIPYNPPPPPTDTPTSAHPSRAGCEWPLQTPIQTWAGLTPTGVVPCATAPGPAVA